MPFHRVNRIGLAAVLFLLTGCSDNLIGPDNQLEVLNVADTFDWQVTALDKVTQTLRYSWMNTGTTANVHRASSLGSGSAAIRITDAAGAEVYTGTLGVNTDEQTSAGTTGDWTVVVTLTDATGTLNFRLEKP